VQLNSNCRIGSLPALRKVTVIASGSAAALTSVTGQLLLAPASEAKKNGQDGELNCVRHMRTEEWRARRGRF